MARGRRAVSTRSDALPSTGRGRCRFGGHSNTQGSASTRVSELTFSCIEALERLDPTILSQNSTIAENQPPANASQLHLPSTQDIDECPTPRGVGTSTTSHLPSPTQSTPTPDPVQASISFSTTAALSNSKILVWIEGDDILCNTKPYNKPVRSIRPIIQSMFLGPYPSWKKVPPSVRDIWYAKWMKEYKWEHKYDSSMRTKWENKGGESYKHLMEQVRSGEIKHDFMRDAYYDELRAHWDSEGFKKISKIASANRKSDCGGLGGSHHSGGSIPATVHKRKLEEKFHRDYSLCDVYLFTHTMNTEEEVEQVLERERRMLDGEEVELEGPRLVFIDKRSEETYRRFQTELAKEMALLASQTLNGEQPPPVNKADIWLRVVGPPKKAKTIFGMGSLNSSCLEKSAMYKSFSSLSCSSAHFSDYVHTSEIRQSVEEIVHKALSAYVEEQKTLREVNERLLSEVASLSQKVRKFSGLDCSNDAP